MVGETRPSSQRGGEGAGIVVGATKPGVTCKRLADSRPVVVECSSRVEIPFWLLQGSARGKARPEDSFPLASVPVSQTQQALPGANRGAAPAGAPSAKLADVSNSFNLDIKIDDQELSKFMCERRNGSQPASIATGGLAAPAERSKENLAVLADELLQPPAEPRIHIELGAGSGGAGVVREPFTQLRLQQHSTRERRSASAVGWRGACNGNVGSRSAAAGRPASAAGRVGCDASQRLRPMLGSTGPVRARAISLGTPVGASASGRQSRSASGGCAGRIAATGSRRAAKPEAPFPQATAASPSAPSQAPPAARSMPRPEAEEEAKEKEEPADIKAEGLRRPEEASTSLSGVLVAAVGSSAAPEELHDVERSLDGGGDSEEQPSWPRDSEEAPLPSHSTAVAIQAALAAAKEGLAVVGESEATAGLSPAELMAATASSAEVASPAHPSHEGVHVGSTVAEPSTSGEAIEEPSGLLTSASAEPGVEKLQESLSQLSDLLTERCFVPARTGQGAASAVSSSATTVGGAAGPDRSSQAGVEPQGDALRESMHQLTAQLRGLFQSLSSEEQTETEHEDQARQRGPGPLTASLAQTAHRQVERLVLGEDAVAKSNGGVSTAATEVSAATREALHMVERLSADDEAQWQESSSTCVSAAAAVSAAASAIAHTVSAQGEQQQAATSSSATAGPAEHAEAAGPAVKLAASLLAQVPGTSTAAAVPLSSGAGAGHVPSLSSTAPVPKRPPAAGAGTRATSPTRPAPPAEPRPSGAAARRPRPRPAPGSPEESQTLQRDHQQRGSKESSAERRKRLGLVGIPRTEGSAEAGNLPLESRFHSDSGDEVKRRRGGGWYSTQAAKELVSAEMTRRRREEREKRQQDNLRRRLESTYNRPRASSAGPTVSVRPSSSAAAAPPTAAELHEVQQEAAEDPQPQAPLEGIESQTHQREQRQSSKESSAERRKRLGLVGIPRAEGSAEAGNLPLERPTSAPQLRAMSTIAKGRRPTSAGSGNGAGVPATGPGSACSAGLVPNRRTRNSRPRVRRALGSSPAATESTKSHASNRRTSAMVSTPATASAKMKAERRDVWMEGADVFEDEDEEEDACWTEPEVSVRPMLAWAAAEAARTRLAASASLSDGGESQYSSRWTQEASQARLADRIRSETLKRARRRRESMLDTSDEHQGAWSRPSQGPEDGWFQVSSGPRGSHSPPPQRIPPAPASQAPPGAANWFGPEVGERAWGTRRAELLHLAESAAAAVAGEMSDSEELQIHGGTALGDPIEAHGLEEEGEEDHENQVKSGATQREEEEDDDEEEASASYLTNEHRRVIGEVLAERHWLRQEGAERTESTTAPRSPPGWPVPTSSAAAAAVAAAATASGRPGTAGLPWASHTGGPGSCAMGSGQMPAFRDVPRPETRGRPPSRGGESWQPLGQTTPPAYEQVTPELFELWQSQEAQPPRTGPPSASPERSTMLADVEELHTENDERQGPRASGITVTPTRAPVITVTPTREEQRGFQSQRESEQLETSAAADTHSEESASPLGRTRQGLHMEVDTEGPTEGEQSFRPALPRTGMEAHLFAEAAIARPVDPEILVSPVPAAARGNEAVARLGSEPAREPQESDADGDVSADHDESYEVEETSKDDQMESKSELQAPGAEHNDWLEAAQERPSEDGKASGSAELPTGDPKHHKELPGRSQLPKQLPPPPQSTQPSQKPGTPPPTQTFPLKEKEAQRSQKPEERLREEEAQQLATSQTAAPQAPMAAQEQAQPAKALQSTSLPPSATSAVDTSLEQASGKRQDAQLEGGSALGDPIEDIEEQIEVQDEDQDAEGDGEALTSEKKVRQDQSPEVCNPEGTPPSSEEPGDVAEERPRDQIEQADGKRLVVSAPKDVPARLGSSISGEPTSTTPAMTASSIAATPAKPAGTSAKPAGAASSPGSTSAAPVVAGSPQKDLHDSKVAAGTAAASVASPFPAAATAPAATASSSPAASSRAAGSTASLAEPAASVSTGAAAALPAAHTTPPLRASAIAPPVSPMAATRAGGAASTPAPATAATRAAAGAAPWIGTQNVAVKVSHSNSSLSSSAVAVAVAGGRPVADPCGSPGAGRPIAPSTIGRTPQSEEDGDISSGTSASNSNAWLASPGRSECASLKDMMRHSKHKHMIRKLIPSFPSPDEPHMQHSAPSSTRSLQSNSSSSSAAASNDRAMEGDRFTRFTCDLAKKIDKEEEARASMVEQLFRLQQKALEKKVREKLRHLKVMEAERSPRWVEKRMRKVRMRAEAENAEIERQLAESKALHARRKLRLSEMENQVYSWRSSTLRLKKRSQSQDSGAADGGDAAQAAAAAAGSSRASSAPPSRGDASPFSSGYSTPSSTPSSSKKLLPTMPVALTAKVGALARGQERQASSQSHAGDGGGSSASAASRLDSSTSPGSIKAPTVAHGDPAAASEHGLVTERSSATEHGNATEPESSATARSAISEPSVATRSATDAAETVKSVTTEALRQKQAEPQEVKASKQLSQRSEEQKGHASTGTPVAAAPPSTSTSTSSGTTAAARQGSSTQQPTAADRSGSQRKTLHEAPQTPEASSQLASKRQGSKETVRKEATTHAKEVPPSSTSAARPTAEPPLGALDPAPVQAPDQAPISPGGPTSVSRQASASSATSGAEDSYDKDEIMRSESLINQKLEALRRDMKATKGEIQAARHLSEKEAKYKVLQRQKEAARQLYDQKQNLVFERVRLLQLEQEEREVNDLLDKALNLSVDEEVQRQIHEAPSSPKHDPTEEGLGEPSMPRTPSPPRPKPQHEWEARETHLEKLRSQLAEKRRSVEQLHAERLRQRQMREEERLLRDIQKVEEEAEKLRHPPESDVESTGSAGASPATATPAATTVPATGMQSAGPGQLPQACWPSGGHAEEQPGGTPAYDAFDAADLSMLSQAADVTAARKAAAAGMTSTPESEEGGSEGGSEPERNRSIPGTQPIAGTSSLRQQSPRGLPDVPGEDPSRFSFAEKRELFEKAAAEEPAASGSEDSDDDLKDRSISELCEDVLGDSEDADAAVNEGQAPRSRVASVSSTHSSDDLWQIEEVEVIEGKNEGFKADEWVISPRAAPHASIDEGAGAAMLIASPHQAGDAAASSSSSSAENFPERRAGSAAASVDADLIIRSADASSAAAEVSLGDEEAIARDPASAASTAGPRLTPPPAGGGLFAGGVTVDISNPAAKVQLTNEMVSVIVDELIDDTLQTTSAAGASSGLEPVLRQPTPLAPAALIADMFNEDGASSVESEPVVLPAPAARRALAPETAERRGQAPAAEGPAAATESRPVSSSSSSAADEDSSQGAKAQKKQAVDRKVQLPFEGDADKAKLPGPPRPPSPPPDVRPSAAPETATATGQSGQSLLSRQRNSGLSRQETAELISQELLDMLLGEVWAELDGTAPPAAEAERPAAASPASPVEEVRSTWSTSGPSPPLPGHQPIDTSEAVVGPFLEAAFKQLGVADEAMTVSGPIAPMEEWFPSVLDVIQKRDRMLSGRMDQDRSSGPRKKRMLVGEGGDDVDLDVGEEDLDMLPDELAAKLHEEVTDPGSPSGGATANSMQNMRDRDVESFTRLLGEALLEIASEEVKELGPRILGWRRPGFGEPPLARFREKQVAEGRATSQQQTWEKVGFKLRESVRCGFRTEGGGDGEAAVPAIGGSSGIAASHASGTTAASLDAEIGAGAGATLANIDEGIDALLEEEICSDEASWLDIRQDVREVKNQVAHMIFADLIEEVVAEIDDMWSA
eukprot:TRINITY_DN3947_c0_g2_i2.p1 TRINITY_DN3947_c0_g2~~TRINITY_DN3947_c0_g2_i2.p1  ORF type:complete len:3759 (-),score=912.49 TRINITY_DN3947_c0_g2_i2:186-11462(-)